MKVTYVSSGAIAPYRTFGSSSATETSGTGSPSRNPNTLEHATPPLSSASVATYGFTQGPTTATSTAAAMSSTPASPLVSNVNGPSALNTDAARLSPYVSLVRRPHDATHRFGPPGQPAVRLLPQSSSGSGSGHVTSAVSPSTTMAGMRTAYTPVAAMASPRAFATSSSSFTAAHTPLTRSSTSATPMPKQAAPVPAKAPITQYMADHTYIALRDAAGRPVAAPPLDLVPPFRFAAVEEGLFRGAYPVLRNFPFLKSLGVRTIISLVPEDPTFDLQTFSDVERVDLHHIQAERFKGETQLLPTDVNSALNILLDRERYPVYIHCLDGKQVVGLIVMALRKLMQWDIQRAHHEYLRFCHGEEEDEVAFIIDYTGPITVPLNVPPFLSERLYEVDARGVRRPRKYPCGIKLKYPVEDKALLAGQEGLASASAGTARDGGDGRACPQLHGVEQGGAHIGGGVVDAAGKPVSEAVPPRGLSQTHAHFPSGGVVPSTSGNTGLTPNASPTGSSALHAAATLEGKLAVEETRAALSINLPWSELVSEKGVYFDVDHIGYAQPHASAMVPAHARVARAGSPYDDSSKHTSPQPHQPHHDHPVHTTHSSGGHRRHAGSADRAQPTTPRSRDASHHSSTNTSLAAPPPCLQHGMAMTSSVAAVGGVGGGAHSHTTSAASTPPFAPVLTNVSTHTDAEKTVGGAPGGGGGGFTSSGASSSVAPPAAATAPSRLPSADLSYFSLGRPGGSLPPVLPSPHKDSPLSRVVNAQGEAGSPVYMPLHRKRPTASVSGAALDAATGASVVVPLSGNVNVGVVSGGGGGGAGVGNHPRDGRSHNVADNGSGTSTKPRPKRRYSL